MPAFYKPVPFQLLEFESCQEIWCSTDKKHRKYVIFDGKYIILDMHSPRFPRFLDLCCPQSKEGKDDVSKIVSESLNAAHLRPSFLSSSRAVFHSVHLSLKLQLWRLGCLRLQTGYIDEAGIVPMPQQRFKSSSVCPSGAIVLVSQRATQQLQAVQFYCIFAYGS